MQLVNLTKKTVLSRDSKEAKSVRDKLFGLLLKSNPKSLLFKTRFGIHTFFLKEPIDVLILDSMFQVAKAQTIRPNSIFIYNPKYLTVIELPQNTIKRTKTQIGDKIKIKLSAK